MDQPGTDIPDDQTAYLHDWINATYPEQQTVQDIRADECLTVQFYQCCLSALQKTCQQLSAADSLEYSPLSQVKCVLQEELGRLYLCGDGFSSGEAADALERSDDLTENILEILCGIGSLLIRDIPRMLSDKMPSIEVIQNQDSKLLRSLIEESKSFAVVDHDSDIIESDTDDSASFLSNDYDPCDELRSLVQMMLDLVPSLEATIEHQKRIIYKCPYAPDSKFQASDPAQVYISWLHDKFPLASEKLKERLGEANWQRHLNIRRRMEQIESHQGQEPNEARNGNERATIAGSVFQPQTLFHDSGIGTTVASQSQYAQTEASHTSFVSSLAEQEKGKLRVPPTPLEVGTGEPFRCHLCGFVQIKIKNRIDWKRHVFQDLLPYICTFPDCENELRQFPTRQAWADHEFDEHRTVKLWACPKCSYESRSSEEWSDHLKDYHQKCFSEAQISSVISTACKRIPKPVQQEECFLCNNFPCKTRRSLVAHIGKHMEEVALMALPRDDADDAEDSSGSGDGSVKIVNNSSAAGHRTRNQSGRCPFASCDRFSEDLMAHLLTHYDGKWECGFCAGSGPATEDRSYSRADVFKGHLLTVHGAEPTPPYTGTSSVRTVKCFVCSEILYNAQGLYTHLDECLIRCLIPEWENAAETINDQHHSDEARQQITKGTIGTLKVFPEASFHGHGHGQTPVARACATGNLEQLVRESTEHSQYLNVPDSVRRTPLQIAVIGGYVKIVRYLIERGCLIDTKDLDGATPLTDAVEKGNPEIVELLLKAGADPYLPNGKGLEPLDLVIKDYADYEAIEKSLLAAKERHSLLSNGEKLTAQDRESSISKTKAKIEYLNRKFGNPPTAVKEELQEMLKVLVNLKSHETQENLLDRDKVSRVQRVSPDPVYPPAIDSSDNAPSAVCDVTERITSATGATQQPPKSSNIMNILNDEPPDHSQERKSVISQVASEETADDASGKPAVDSGRIRGLSQQLEAPVLTDQKSDSTPLKLQSRSQYSSSLSDHTRREESPGVSGPNVEDLLFPENPFRIKSDDNHPTPVCSNLSAPTWISPSYSTNHPPFSNTSVSPNRAGPGPIAPDQVGEKQDLGQDPEVPSNQDPCGRDKLDGFGPGDRGKRRGRAAPTGRCHSCNRAETPEWRRGPDGPRTLCNACGLHYAKITRKSGPKANVTDSDLPKEDAHGLEQRLQPSDSVTVEVEPSHNEQIPNESSSYTRISPAQSTSKEFPEHPTVDISKPSARPYVCTYQGCTRRFERLRDLHRHTDTHYPTLSNILDCPYAGTSGDCVRAGARSVTSEGGFTRGDRFKDHLRRVHGVKIPEGGAQEIYRKVKADLEASEATHQG